MAELAFVELRNLKLTTDLGTYGSGDVVPTGHYLDLTLGLDRKHVLIGQDDMSAVFDYDPLIAEIDRLARDGHYETQERLMTRILEACATYPEIKTAEISLCKTPVLGVSGRLGMRIALTSDELAALRLKRAA